MREEEVVRNRQSRLKRGSREPLGNLVNSFVTADGGVATDPVQLKEANFIHLVVSFPKE